MEKYLYQDLQKLEDKHFWHIAKKQRILSLLSKYFKGQKYVLLDIGCGTGKNLQALQKFGSVWGIDNSPEAIKYCRVKNLKVKLATSDKTGFPAGFFDAVALLDVLEHVREDQTLKEIKRVLKPDKYLIITVPAFSWLWSRWDVVLHHKRRYSKDSLQKVLNNNNFKVLEISYMYSFLVLPALLVRAVKSIFYKKYYPSDFKLSSPLVNKIMLAMANLEKLISDKIPIPFGTSIICLASNNEK